jgi:hypothetical protein
MGGPDIPAAMYTTSAVHVQMERVTLLSMTVDPPAVNVDESLDVVLNNIPAGETAARYRVAVYARTPAGLVGPLPTCASTFPVTQDPNNPTLGQAHVLNWAQGNAGLVQAATGFRVALFPAPYVPAGDACLNGAATIPASAPSIVEVEAARALPPSATLTPSPTPSRTPVPSPSSSPSASSVPAASASASAAPSINAAATPVGEGASDGADDPSANGAGSNIVAAAAAAVVGMATTMALLG